MSLIFELGPNNSRPQHSTAGYRCRAHGACPVSATTRLIPKTKDSDAVVFVGVKTSLGDLPKLRLSKDTCSSGSILAWGGCFGWGSRATSVRHKMHGVGGKPSHSIDWGERSSQPISKVDEPVCLKISRRNFKILRAMFEQETAENNFGQGPSSLLQVCQFIPPLSSTVSVPVL